MTQSNQRSLPEGINVRSWHLADIDGGAENVRS